MEGNAPTRQPWANNKNAVTTAVVLVGLVVLGAILYFVLHKSTHTGKQHKSVLGPIVFTASNLKAESKFIHARFYWAGPQTGTGYEFTRNKKGWLFVRYLPTGTKPGAPGGNYLIVTTYNYPAAYKNLKKKAKSKGFNGPGGSIVYVDPRHRTNVYMAFPGVDQEIEIYDPVPAIALATARSGKIRPVLG